MKIENFDRVLQLMAERDALKKELDAIESAQDDENILLSIEKKSRITLRDPIYNTDYNNSNLNRFPHNIQYRAQVFINEVIDIYKSRILEVEADIEKL